MVKGKVKKIKNWTTSGNDEVHGCWLKHLTSQHTRIAKELNLLFQTGTIVDWMTTGKTALLMKNKEYCTILSKYRPIICLSTTSNLMTASMAESMLNHFEMNGLIPDEKFNRKNSRGTKYYLLIDKMMLWNAKSQEKS